ncbi:SLC13 family permease [Helicobacter pylori]|uniref:SLC13 family permease n=1 Tax=Helicobacter pylori TaxID=210 RepID=UPI000C30F110|nr:SLC13 family permease [Helicobacter pylori]
MENHSHANTHTDTHADDKSTKIVRLLGLIGGTLIALIIYYVLNVQMPHIVEEIPKLSSLNYKAMPVVAGVAVLMGIWWMTEAIDLPATALLPLVLFSVFSVDQFASVSSSYASPIIFLFMGGFILALSMLILAWLLLTYAIFPLKIKEIPGGKEVVKSELNKLGRLSQAEISVGILFILASLGWIFLDTILKSWGIKIDKIDSVIAMGVSVLLFILPANNQGDRLIDWGVAKKLPWDVLLLFGGGLALSTQFSKTGLSLWIGHLVSGFSHLPILFIIVMVTLMVIFLTEITSNTATAAAFLPVIGGVAMGMGYENHQSLLLTIPVALSATCAFMLPVATPPNAIAYGSGYVKITDMIKAGLWLNLVGVVLISSFSYFLVSLIFN